MPNRTVTISVLSLMSLLACNGDEVNNDKDGDGVTTMMDCDDSNATVYPNAPELCDGLDNDCDDEIDEDATDAPLWYVDADGDGFGQPAKAEGINSCEPLDGYADNALDCDDSSVTSHPEADEYCDGIDTDCDGALDNDPLDGDPYYPDEDLDGYGDEDQMILSCTSVDGHITQGGDCDDEDDTIHHGLEEICDDGIDQDCDGIIDDTCLDTQSVSTAASTISATASTAFGSALATGDFNGDGVQDIAVGASGDYTDAYFGGSVSLFSGTDLSGMASESDAYAVYHGAVDYGYLGANLLGVGDLDGDGADELVVSAYGSDTVTLFSGQSGDWSWAVGATFTGDVDLGRYIIASGDYTDDGEVDILLNGDGVDDAGAAYLFAGPFDGTYSTTDARLTIVGSESEADLGFAGQLADVDGDGRDELIVTQSALDAGSVLVFLSNQSGVVLPEDADVILVGDESSDQFGDCIAVGDANGDGAVDLAVSAPGESTLASNAGAVYLFSNVMTAVTPADADLTIFATDTSDNLGHHAGDLLLSDLNADGRDDLVIGFYGDDSVFDNAGGAYVVFGERTGSWTIMETDVRFVGDAESAQVGKALSSADIDGDGVTDLIVGSSSASPQKGAVWLFLGLEI